MKKHFLVLFLALTGICTEKYVLQAQNTDLTTFILVRHTEKADDGTKDPGLTTEGQQRAERLAALMQNAGITAIYSTNFRRTQLTAAPLATALELEIQSYDPGDTEWLKQLLKAQKGGTFLIVGHSNTTPALVNQLIGKDAYKMFEEQEYGRLMVVTASRIGKGKVLEINY